MSSRVLLGIDLGTSSVKSVVIEPGGKVMGLAAREYPVAMPQAGWAEQNPETWVAAALESAREAINRAGVLPAGVAAIGLSGQMHGTVCLDAAGAPLRPAIIWADQRSAAQVARVYREIGAERLGAWTCNPLATGFMLASWLWLIENEPEIAWKTATLLLPKDYLRYRMTGALGTEPSDASSTLLFDTAQRDWSRELLNALGIAEGLLPPVGESAQIAGRLASEAATAMGLSEGTPVVFGGSDQALQAVGHGVIAPGVISSTVGTGGQLFAPLAQPAYDWGLRLHLFCHAAPGLWHLEAAILSAGLSLRWLRDNVFMDMDYQQIADLAAAAPPGAEGLYFLPHLAGERTPHMDPDATGAFIGLTLRHTRAHMARAVMEGVIFAMRQGLDLMVGLGAPAERIVASGGASAHPLWLQLQADIYGRPIYRTQTVEASAYGAALLAGVGAGVYHDLSDACARAVVWGDAVIAPDVARAPLYDAAYRTFCGLYPALSAARVPSGDRFPGLVRPG
jgi:xylulokinase